MTASNEQFGHLEAALHEAITQIHRETLSGDSTLLKADAAKLVELKQRLVSGQFHLAVLGQFKRGKSTLLNSLLGEDILPTAVVPLTAIPTWIRFGKTPLARVEFANSKKFEQSFASAPEALSDFLTRFVTESANPKNRLGVERVDIYRPASILENGLVFIDTPGIGSTFRHNTETTLHFLSECDAALFVVSADPPISETELEFLRLVKSRVTRIFFILNKVDYLNRLEAEEAMKFFRNVLCEQAGFPEDVPIFPVSARNALHAKRAGDGELWRVSGMADVEHYLMAFLVQEKSRALEAAVRQKAIDVVEDVMIRLRMALRSLELPLEDLLSRLATFDKRIEDLQHQRQEAHDLLAGDKRRTHESLEKKHKALCLRINEKLSHLLDKALSAAGDQVPSEPALQQALNATIPALFEVEFKNDIRLFEDHLIQVLRPHQERLDKLVESIRKTAADLFEVPYHPMDNAVAIDQTREPYWLTYRYEESFGPISPSTIDKLVPPGMRRRRIERRFKEKIEYLVMFNAGKLREKLYDQVEMTFSRFGRELDERGAAAVAATRDAAQTALRRRQKHMDAVSSDIDRLRVFIEAIDAAAARLKATAGRVDTVRQGLVSSIAS